MERDPGLQPERTYLSWRRTGLSYLTLCLFAFRHEILSSQGALFFLALSSLPLFLIALTSGNQLNHHIEMVENRKVHRRVSLIVLTALLVSATGILIVAIS